MAPTNSKAKQHAAGASDDVFNSGALNSTHRRRLLAADAGKQPLLSHAGVGGGGASGTSEWGAAPARCRPWVGNLVIVVVLLLGGVEILNAHSLDPIDERAETRVHGVNHANCETSGWA